MKQVLVYGDSNTWGLIPGTTERYPWGVRWTSILQEKLKNEEVRIIEEGLCGRTTIFEDVYRENRNGLKTLPLILESNKGLDAAVIMLGTNDCKSHYSPNAYKIAKGLEQCLDRLLLDIPAENILVVSPIHLGEDVWKPEFDPEFDKESVEVSKKLKEEYRKITTEKNISFIAASDYVSPSIIDNEHMDEEGHGILAEKIYVQIMDLLTRGK